MRLRRCLIPLLVLISTGCLPPQPRCVVDGDQMGSPNCATNQMCIDGVCEDRDDPLDARPDGPSCAGGEGELGQVCHEGVGRCSFTGVYACIDSMVVCRPDGQPFGGEDERCNGLDDDCNGRIDEELFGGRCRIEGAVAGCWEGKLRCIFEDGQGDPNGICVGDPPEPGDEKCNGCDDDADGAVDEDELRWEDNGDGRISRPEISRLTCGDWSARDPEREQEATAYGPAAREVCNGIDDTGNGTIDDDIDTVGDQCSVSSGIVGNPTSRCDTGEIRCNAFVLTEERLSTLTPDDWENVLAEQSLDCVSRNYDAITERCNDFDDDCDGDVDEIEDVAKAGDQCTTGVSACHLVTGHWACDLEVNPPQPIALHCVMPGAVPANIDDCTRCAGAPDPPCNGAGADDAPVFVPNGWVYVDGDEMQGIEFPFLMEVREYMGGGQSFCNAIRRANGASHALGHEVGTCYPELEEGSCAPDAENPWSGEPYEDYRPAPEIYPLTLGGECVEGAECPMTLPSQPCWGSRLPLRREWEHAAHVQDFIPRGADQAACIRFVDDYLTRGISAPNQRGLYAMVGGKSEMFHPRLVALNERDDSRHYGARVPYGGGYTGLEPRQYCDEGELDADLFVNAPEDFEALSEADYDNQSPTANNDTVGHRLIIPLRADPRCPPTGCPVASTEEVPP